MRHWPYFVTLPGPLLRRAEVPKRVGRGSRPATPAIVLARPSSRPIPAGPGLGGTAPP